MHYLQITTVQTVRVWKVEMGGNYLDVRERAEQANEETTTFVSSVWPSSGVLWVAVDTPRDTSGILRGALGNDPPTRVLQGEAPQAPND